MLSGPLPVRPVRGPATARRVGPHRGPRARARRRATRRDRERRHHPRPRPLRRVPPRRPAGRRARRGDGLREPAGRDLPARRVDVAHRGDHLRPGDRHARARRAREDAVLEGRPAGPAARTGPRARRDGARPARHVEHRRRSATARRRASTVAPPRTSCATSRNRPRRPARCPTTARSSSSGSPTRSATGGCACSRRSVRACTRRGRSRSRSGSRASTCRCRCCGATTGSSAASPRRSRTSRSTCCSSTPTRSRTSSSTRPAVDVAVRVAVPGERRPGVAAARAGARASARRCGSNASAPPTCSRSRRATRRSRSCWRRRAKRCATCSTCPSLREVLTDVRSRQRARRTGRDAPRVTVRAVAAVRVDRRLHVRGRRAARRTAGRRARARPRPVARPARCRGTTRAARPAGARRPRARTAAARRRNARPQARRRPPRHAREPRPARRATSIAARTERRRPGTVGRRPARANTARSRCASPARTASPRPRTRPACATRSASRSRPGLPTAFTDPVPAPLDDLVARYARTHGPFGVGEVADHSRRDPRARAARRSPTSNATAACVYGEFRPGGVEREWCDAGVLRVLRRRSLAALRHEIEPVDATTLARFLPAWQRRRARPAWHGRARRDPRATARRRDPRVGARTRRAARARQRLPRRRCSTSCARPASWCGSARGRSATTTAACARYFRDRIRLLAPHRQRRRTSRRPAARRDPRATCRARARRSGPTSSPAHRHGRTRPCCSPRCGTSCGRARSPTTRSARCARRAAPRSDRRHRAAAARRSAGSPGSGRPAGAGRWSLVAPLLEPRPEPDRGRAHGVALQLLERHGIVTRESVRAEGVAGGFAGVYPVFKALEEAGPRAPRVVRRGHGRRAVRVAGRGRPAPLVPRGPSDDETPTLVLAATDPAQPYGGAIAWPDHPGRPAAPAGAYVVLARG